MHTKKLSEIINDLKNKKISSVELTTHYLNRIEKLDPQYNSFITVCKEEALLEAKKADELLAKNAGQPLTGVPLAQKDIFCTLGIKTSCGSKMLDNFISPYDATVVEKC